MPAWNDLNLTDALTGLWWVVVAILGGIGVRGGIKRSGALPSPSTVAVSGDVVVVQRLDELIKAIDMLTTYTGQKSISLQKNTGALDAYTEGLSEVRRAIDRNTEQVRNALERSTEATREAAEEAERVARAMREHADRMIRLGPSGHG